MYPRFHPKATLDNVMMFTEILAGLIRVLKADRMVLKLCILR